MNTNKGFHFAFIFFLLLGMLAGSAQATQAQGSQISGWFSVVWGDSQDGQPAAPVYRLASDDGQRYRLSLNEDLAAALGGAVNLNRRRVTVEGTPQVSALGGGNVIEVRGITLEGGPQVSALADVSALAVTGAQPYATIMCKFKDVSDTPKNLAYFEGMYSASPPGLNHYWQELSYNTINTNGSNAYGWYTLPQYKSYYVYNDSLDFFRAAYDCTKAADSHINYANFKGINLMFNDNLDGYAWGGNEYLTLDGKTQLWPMTWEPPWGYENIGVIAHEMGHAFGLPHSTFNPAEVYDNVWDVMSDHWGICNYSAGNPDSVYGCLGQHTISYHKSLLGWIPAAQKTSVGINSARILTLEQLAQPQTENYRMVAIPLANSSYFYTLEARTLTGYDAPLPGAAVIIHQVLSGRAEPAHIKDADGNGDTADAGAMWTVGETFTDNINKITVNILEDTGSGFVVEVINGNAAPKAFNKTGPTSNTINLPLTPTLTWGKSSAATSYEYCYHADLENPCLDWRDAGALTSVTLDPLNTGTAYEWQVRAVNKYGTSYANASADSYWSFRTGEPPATFKKTYPTRGIADVSLSPKLAWMKSAGITPAAAYEYCMDTSNDNACDEERWKANGLSTAVELRNLPPNLTYYWQARAVNDFGITYADEGAWASFTSGALQQAAFTATASQSGWLLESRETSNAAAVKNNSGDLRLGDDSRNRQYRALLTFSTSALADNIQIMSATLRIKKSGGVGGDPFATHGNLLAEIKKGSFGLAALELADFKTRGATLRGASFLPAGEADVYELRLPRAYFKLINTGGTTQFRLRFALDDDNDRAEDLLTLFRNGADAPQLRVEYTE